MVSKITLFEPHFDGATIGPSVLGSPSESDRVETDESSTVSPFKLVMLSILVSIVVAALAKKFATDRDGDLGHEQSVSSFSDRLPAMKP